jgi:hypothetical protein
LTFAILIPGSLGDKCRVIVFNEQVSSNSTTRMFVLGKEIIKETESYTHLGLACDKYLSTQKPLTEAGNRLRGTV